MERDDVVELGAVLVGVGLFVAALAVVGSMYGANGGATIRDSGRLALIGALAFFVALMAGVGFWIAERNA